MRKKDENGEDDLGGIFKGLDRFINIVADMIENDKDEVNLNGVINPDGEKKITGRYGVNIKLGGSNLNSLDKLKTLNDIMDKKNALYGEKEPSTETFDEEDKVIIVMELTGVDKKDIELNINEDILTVKAMASDTCYFKKIKLKFIPDTKYIKSNLINSIYSIEIKKKEVQQ